MHPKIQAVDKKKEAEKDKVMMKLQSEGKLRYIKIVNKDYTEFFKLISELNQMYGILGCIFGLSPPSFISISRP